MDTQNTHNPQTADKWNFKGCKHFSSFINNSNNAIDMVLEIDDAIFEVLSIAYQSQEDLSKLPKIILTLRTLKSLFICTAIEKGENLNCEIYNHSKTNSCITEIIF